MIRSTVARVPEHTADSVNEEIRRRTRENIARYAAASPEAIDRRLAELDREWDIERTLEANAATITLVGLGLGAFVDCRFYLLPAAVAGFLALQGKNKLQDATPPAPEQTIETLKEDAAWAKTQKPSART